MLAGWYEEQNFDFGLGVLLCPLPLWAFNMSHALPPAHAMWGRTHVPPEGSHRQGAVRAAFCGACAGAAFASEKKVA